MLPLIKSMAIQGRHIMFVYAFVCERERGGEKDSKSIINEKRSLFQKKHLGKTRRSTFIPGKDL